MTNYNMVIVNMAYLDIYDFLRENETEQEAEERGNNFYRKNLELVKEHLKDYGGEYWEEQVKNNIQKVKAGCKLMPYEEFKKLERKKLLDGKLTEITKEKFEEMFDTLPPLFWTTHDNVEMFCMREMYTGRYTTQYAHDRNRNKYYSAMVDCKDKSTWICELLKR